MILFGDHTGSQPASNNEVGWLQALSEHCAVVSVVDGAVS